jgi:subtilisin family serine protease
MSHSDSGSGPTRRSGAGVTVAVIDGGWGTSVLTDDRVLPIAPLVQGVRTPDSTPGHGELCTLRVLQVAPECRVLPVEVVARGMETSVELLCRGVEFAASEGAHVISVSLATRLSNAIAPLFRVCESARRRGVIIVAAADNSGHPAVPAYLEPVLSVDEGPQASLFEVDFRPDAPIECRAAGLSVPIVDGAGRSWRRSGSSIATATVAGIVARLRAEGPADLDRVRSYLAERPSTSNPPSPTSPTGVHP